MDFTNHPVMKLGELVSYCEKRDLVALDTDAVDRHQSLIKAVDIATGLNVTSDLPGRVTKPPNLFVATIGVFLVLNGNQKLGKRLTSYQADEINRFIDFIYQKESNNTIAGYLQANPANHEVLTYDVQRVLLQANKIADLIINQYQALAKNPKINNSIKSIYKPNREELINKLVGSYKDGAEIAVAEELIKTSNTYDVDASVKDSLPNHVVDKVTLNLNDKAAPHGFASGLYTEAVPSINRLRKCFVSAWGYDPSLISLPVSSYNTAFIIDRSGSMGEILVGQDNGKSQKLARALTAVRAKVKGMNDDEYLSISSFSNGGTTQLQSVALGAVRAQISQKLAGITAGGGTNIGAGLAEGRKQLEKSGGYVLLLSDGKGSGWQSELVKYKAKNWPICTMAYGADADVATLKHIANESGCTYTPSDASNVANRMRESSAYAQNKSLPLSITDLLSPSAQVSYPYSISQGSKQLDLYTSWQGSRLSTILVSPSGQRIEVENLTGQDGRYSEGDTYQNIELNNPESGNWT